MAQCPLPHLLLHSSFRHVSKDKSVIPICKPQLLIEKSHMTRNVTCHNVPRIKGYYYNLISYQNFEKHGIYPTQ